MDVVGMLVFLFWPWINAPFARLRGFQGRIDWDDEEPSYPTGRV
jgi:hypothetical protein